MMWFGTVHRHSPTKQALRELLINGPFDDGQANGAATETLAHREALVRDTA
jgi:hypothetical protein